PLRAAAPPEDARPPAAPSAGAAGPAELLAAWRELWSRQRAGMPASWARRAARDWARCLTTFVTEASHRTAGTLPTVGQAVHLRRHASCLYPFMNMLERVRGTALPEEMHAERELRLLRAHVADTATLINDLYSLEREERHACPFNMIVILQREQHMSRPAAVEAVRAEVDRLGARSDILRNYLTAHHPEADWYLRGTGRLVEGVRLWSSTTDRYTDTSL
ncbi:terpene synthase family protein, partial [Streptomyces fuscigenes]|uniref:terpene synthase family protein n=1 Tax=Streptomyces fuscigenes TaxID=1528880 RepID=UPI001F2CE4CE